EDHSCRQDRGSCYADLSASCHIWWNVFFYGVDGRHRIHATTLFRLFRLYRYGARVGAGLRNLVATELRFAGPRVQHHRILAAMAHDTDAFPDGLYLQSIAAVAYPTPAGKGAARIGWA